MEPNRRRLPVKVCGEMCWNAGLIGFGSSIQPFRRHSIGKVIYILLPRLQLFFT